MADSNVMKGNGKNPAGSDGHVGGYFAGLAHQAEFPNAQKDLLRPGDSPRELLMRSYFKYEVAINQVCRLLKKFKDNNMSANYAEMVLNKMAGMCSLGGMSRAELVMLLSGVVSEPYVEIAARQRSGGTYSIDKNKKKDKEEKKGKEE